MQSSVLLLSNGFLTTALALTMTVPAISAIALPELETDPPTAQVVIKEWRWRDMDL